jgi:hypothetical protein
VRAHNILCCPSCSIFTCITNNDKGMVYNQVKILIFLISFFFKKRLKLYTHLVIYRAGNNFNMNTYVYLRTCRAYYKINKYKCRLRIKNP